MHFIDYSKYENTSLEIYNIGWLDINSAYPTGQVETSFIDKLIVLKQKLLTNQTRGVYACRFCSTYSDGDYVINGKKLFLGSSEIWIPNPSFDKIFACPNLVIHYIDMHNYLPPRKFIDAVNEFNLNSNFSSEEAYQIFEKHINL